MATLQQTGRVATPRTRAELDALVARRAELQGQLKAAEDRRFILNEQAEDLRPDARGAMIQRIVGLDERIGQLEQQIQGLNDAIVAGLAKPELHTSPGSPVIAEPAVPPMPPIPSFEHVFTVPPPQGSVPVDGKKLVAGGLLTLSLVGLVVWLAVRSAVARMARTMSGGAANAQVSQLQQSVDAIALEVERISENQRYVTRLLNQQSPEAAAALLEQSRDERVSAGRDPQRRG